MTQSSPRQKEVFFSDFLSDFSTNPYTKDLVRVTNEKAIINSLKKILKTNNFEIPYNAYFGANINNYLFEPFSAVTEMELKNEITFAIENFESRCKILDLVVNGYPDENSIEITLTFSLINSNNPVTFTTLLTRVR